MGFWDRLKGKTNENIIPETRILPRPEEVDVAQIIEPEYEFAFDHFWKTECPKMYEAEVSFDEFYADYINMSDDQLAQEAQSGEKKAQVVMGEKALRKDNYEEAFRWFSLAYAQTSSDATYRLGQMYLYGLGVKQDIARGDEYLKKSCEMGMIYQAAMDLNKLHHKSLTKDTPREEAQDDLRWSLVAAFVADVYELEGKADYCSIAASGRFILNNIDMEVYDVMRLHPEFPKHERELTDSILSNAVLGYYFEMDARNSENYDTSYMFKDADMFENLGEAAMKAGKSYADKIFAAGVKAGSDYSAALAIWNAKRNAKDKADPAKYMQDLRHDPLFKEYCVRARKATENSYCERLQAISCYVVALMYSDGDEGTKDMNMAYQYAKKSADLECTYGKELLTQLHR